MSSSKELNSFYRYIPNFITELEEEYLLRKIAETPQPKWKNVTNRRLQIWGGHIGPGNTLLSQPLPSFLTTYPNIIERLAATGVFDQSAHKAPNHVIINEYKPGEGIMPHEDGPSYHPAVATLSLGSHTVFHYHRYRPTEPSLDTVNDPSLSSPEMVASTSRDVFTGPSSSGGGRAIDPNPVLSLLLEPRSVIITMGALYKDYLHCIEEIKEDTIRGAEAADKRDGRPSEDVTVGSKSGLESEEGITKSYIMNNWESVVDEWLSRLVREGGVLERGTRVSLTCRDVEKARKVGLPGFG